MLNLSFVTVRDLIAPLIKQLGQYSSKQIEFEQAILATQVFADPRTLTRALKNLIENAIKYAHSRIQISIEKSDRTIVFIVEDDGPGLDNKNIDELFLPYIRANSAREKPGYGLGLAIIRKIAEWHGGEVTATTSKELGGACFKLILPQHKN